MRVSRERLLDFLGITAITVVVWFYAAGQTPLKDVLSGSPSIAPLGVDITTVTPPVTRIEIRATSATNAPGAP